MKRWEYKIETKRLMWFFDPDDIEKFTMRLNNLGVGGWEMISSNQTEKNQYLIIFKRELIE